MEKHRVLNELVLAILEIYGSYVVSVILYGSVARGTDTTESDVDIALILKSGVTKEMYNLLVDRVVDLELEYDEVLSVLKIDADEFKQWEDILPFYTNIKKDGIVLWNAA